MPAASPSRQVARAQGMAENPPRSMAMRCAPAMNPAPKPTSGPPNRPAVMTAVARRLAKDWAMGSPA